MRTFYFGLSLILLVTLQSCSNVIGGCDKTCFTPPQPFLFNIVDKSTGENVFSSGTYTTDQVNIINTLSSNDVDFTFISVNGLELIQVDGIGWETEIVNLKFSLSEGPIFECYVDAVRSTRNCCNFTEYNEIKITGLDYDFNEVQPGVYTVYLP